MRGREGGIGEAPGGEQEGLGVSRRGSYDCKQHTMGNSEVPLQRERDRVAPPMSKSRGNPQ